MMRPFTANGNLLKQACPMDDILRELSTQLMEFKALKEKCGSSIASV